MATPVLDAIVALLDQNAITYRLIHHEPTRTSEESARVRGERLEIGGKALLVKIRDGDSANAGNFALCVLSAALKLDSAAIKARFNVKKLRFASAEELFSLTGLAPGSVPPFGRPILPLDLFVDGSITRNERIAFNAGSLTDSIVMATADYLRLARPEEFRFSAVD